MTAPGIFRPHETTAPGIFRPSPARGLHGAKRRHSRRLLSGNPESFAFCCLLAKSIKDSGFRIGGKHSRYAPCFPTARNDGPGIFRPSPALRAAELSAVVHAAVTVGSAKMPGAVIPAWTRESRRHGWQINRCNDAAFEPTAPPPPPLRQQPESRVFNCRREAPSHPRSPRRHARSPLSGRPESLLLFDSALPRYKDSGFPLKNLRE